MLASIVPMNCVASASVSVSVSASVSASPSGAETVNVTSRDALLPEASTSTCTVWSPADIASKFPVAPSFSCAPSSSDQVAWLTSTGSPPSRATTSNGTGSLL